MKRTLGVIVIISAIVIFFFRPYFFNQKLLFPTNLLMGYYSPWNSTKPVGWEGGVPFKGLGHDNLTIFYPMKTLLRTAIAERSFPFWNPYNFTGAPLFGNGQSAVWYPLNFMYLLIPSLPDAFSIMVLLVPAFTMLFTYGMLRHFRLRPLSALFGAVTFAFCGFMSVWMEENPAVSQSTIWLPLLVWLADLLITKPRRRWFFLFSLSIAIMMASGFLQICLYELIFVAVYIAIRMDTWKNLWRPGMAMGIGLLLDAPYLFVTWESYKLSPRDFVAVPEIRSIFLVQWSHIVSLFSPDWLGNPGTYNFLGAGSYYDKALFIGVVPLVLVLIGLFSRKTSFERMLWWAVGVTLLLGFSSPLTQWLFAQPIPVFSSMLPSRIFYLTSFALSLIAAGVFDRIDNGAWKKTIRPVVAVYCMCIIVVELFLIAALTELAIPDYPLGEVAHAVRTAIVSEMQLAPQLLKIVLRNISISIALTIAAVVSLMLQKKTRLVLFILTVGSAWYFSGKSFYFGERVFVYPEHEVTTALGRIAGIDRVGYADDGSRVKSNIHAIYGRYTPEGVDPVFPLRYGQLVKSAVNGGKVTTDIPRISVDVELRPKKEIDGEAFRIQRLINLLGMEYIVERKESGWYRDVYPKHSSVWEGERFRIWENPDAFPRVFLVATVVPQDDPQSILDTIYNPAIDLRTIAVVEGAQTTGSLVGGTANIVAYRMNDLTVETESTASSFLVLTDNYFPGWHAKVDGIETTPYRTDYAFRGIFVPEGKHTVFWYYFPQTFVYGLWAMGVGIAILVIFLYTKRIPIER